MKLSKDFNDTWNQYYDKLVRFYKKHGHHNVPSDNNDHNKLLEWVLIQKKSKHQLPKQYIEKLSAIDFDFSINQKARWYEKFKELEQFFVKHGHAHVPATDQRYKTLHHWLMTQVRNQDNLDELQKRKLDSLAIFWDIKSSRDWKWQEMYLQLKEFHRNNGHSSVPQKWEENPRLGIWVSVQRRRLSEGNMKKERKTRLDALNFVWDFGDVYEKQWKDKYQKLIDFKKEHGHCKVPLTHKDQQLAGWVDRQRTHKTKGKLSEDRIRKLDQIGFIWDCTVLEEESWEKKFSELLAYKKQYGDCQVPVNWKRNRSLGIWVSTQRTLEKNGKLDPLKKSRLKKIGFVWGKEAWKLQLKKYDQQWEKNFRKLKEYKRKYGTFQVSLTIDRSLEKWTCTQRQHKKIGKLSNHKTKKLDQIGFPWDLHESYWMSMYHQLLRFRNKYGHAKVPWRWKENPQLGLWVSRTRLKQYELTRTQIELLNKIDFEWHVIHKNPVPWAKMFDRLKEFKNEYGHTRVPVTWKKDKKLGKWVSRMRSDQDQLNPERKILLDMIGFDWQKGKRIIMKKEDHFGVELMRYNVPHQA